MTLLVHQLRPPFLDGRVAFTRQQDMVPTVKDPTSDMAVNARNGSALLRQMREAKDRQKMRHRFWELGGSRMGKAMGLEGDAPAPAPASAKQEDEEFDYKASSSFQKNMAEGSSLKTNTGASAFTAKKTVAEQRRSLPAFGVREDLLTVVRDNQVIVVVGETGSGKTTQLTQYLHEDGLTADGGVIASGGRAVCSVLLRPSRRTSHRRCKNDLSREKKKNGRRFREKTAGARSRGAWRPCPWRRASPRRRAAHLAGWWATRSASRT